MSACAGCFDEWQLQAYPATEFTSVVQRPVALLAYRSKSSSAKAAEPPGQAQWRGSVRYSLGYAAVTRE